MLDGWAVAATVAPMMLSVLLLTGAVLAAAVIAVVVLLKRRPPGRHRLTATDTGPSMTPSPSGAHPGAVRSTPGTPDSAALTVPAILAAREFSTPPFSDEHLVPGPKLDTLKAVDPRVPPTARVASVTAETQFPGVQVLPVLAERSSRITGPHTPTVGALISATDIEDVVGFFTAGDHTRLVVTGQARPELRMAAHTLAGLLSVTSGHNDAARWWESAAESGDDPAHDPVLGAAGRDGHPLRLPIIIPELATCLWLPLTSDTLRMAWAQQEARSGDPLAAYGVLLDTTATELALLLRGYAALGARWPTRALAAARARPVDGTGRWACARTGIAAATMLESGAAPGEVLALLAPFVDISDTAALDVAGARACLTYARALHAGGGDPWDVLLSVRLHIPLPAPNAVLHGLRMESSDVLKAT